MRRRGTTLLVGAVVLVILIIASFAGVKVPYVALTPGPTWNTLGTDHDKDVIQISGGPVSSSKGQLRMVTVGVEDEISLWDALRGWLSSDDAVVPREVIYPPDQTQQQVDQENAQDFKNSQNSATVAALRELGFAVHVTVKDIPSGSPSAGRLAAGDELVTVDGQAVTSAAKLTSLVRAKPAGTGLTIGYKRGGTAATTTVTTVAGQDGNPRIGVSIDQQQPNPYKITISLDNVGGPSAGLMFSLGIIDKLEPQDVTGGLEIAGTGTIDDDGKVGAIGGIPQKMRAAKRDGATVFLAPADNCAEAAANSVPGLTLVKVGTLDDALKALSTLRGGGQPILCSAH
jgi:PDZ domain-containing protein